VVPDNKDDLNTIDPAPLAIALLSGHLQRGAATSTSTTKTEDGFLNNWLSGTFSWWSKPAPVVAPAVAPVVIPSLVITPAVP
jgi:hypothetical protein